ncbi:MAG TPA: hypothetical protein VF817_05225 [Patescibacteria group bacterium]
MTAQIVRLIPPSQLKSELNEMMGGYNSHLVYSVGTVGMRSIRVEMAKAIMHTPRIHPVPFLKK